MQRGSEKDNVIDLTGSVLDCIREVGGGGAGVKMRSPLCCSAPLLLPSPGGEETPSPISMQRHAAAGRAC